MTWLLHTNKMPTEHIMVNLIWAIEIAASDLYHSYS